MKSKSIACINLNESLLLTKQTFINKTWRNDMIPTETRVLTAHVPVTLAEKVDLFSNKLERSRGWIIKEALSSWIEQEEKKDLLTWEAISSVDSGKIIDQDLMQNWAQNLSTHDQIPMPL